MARKLQIKRGIKANMPTLAEGELGFATDEKSVYVGTGTGNVLVTGIKAETLAGYGIIDAYTKAEVDSKIGSINTMLDTINGEVV